MSGHPRWGSARYGLAYGRTALAREIMARCDDPNETFAGIQSRPAGPETWAWVREAANRLFDQKSTSAKIRRIPELPLDLAVERQLTGSMGHKAHVEHG